jgi:hypothetical protein
LSLGPGRRWWCTLLLGVLVLGGQRPVGEGGDFEGLADGVFYDLDRQSWWALPDLLAEHPSKRGPQPPTRR